MPLWRPSLVAALPRSQPPEARSTRAACADVLGALIVINSMLFMGLETAAVRYYYPIGHWIAFLGFLPLELNHWVQ